MSVFRYVPADDSARRLNKDGSVVRYVQIAHNKRVNGIAQANSFRADMLLVGLTA